MATPRTEQFGVEFDDGWRVDRMPIGIAAGHAWMTFVFAREAPPADADDSGWALFEDLESRLRIKGVDGTLGHGRQGGGGNARRYAMNFAPELNGTTAIEIAYVKGRKIYAQESIPLGLRATPAAPKTRSVPDSPIVLFDDDMPVHYGYLYLSAGSDPGEDLNAARRGQRNGLCGALIPHQVSMVTGLHTGEVPLRIEWHPQEPSIDESWEDVVEVSTEFTRTEALLSAFDEGFPIELPVTGWHRIRYCAAGMDEGRELDTPDEDEEAPDRYLLQMWLAPESPDEVMVLGSQNAAYWHGVAAGTHT